MTNVRYVEAENGDVDAYCVMPRGHELHGRILLTLDGASVGITGVKIVDLPFGQRAREDSAINAPAYRAKVIETAKHRLEAMFAECATQYPAAQ